MTPANRETCSICLRPKPTTVCRACGQNPACVACRENEDDLCHECQELLDDTNKPTIHPIKPVDVAAPADTCPGLER